MNENFSRKPKSPEQLAIRVEVATEKDWETLKNLRLKAITGEDRDMFGGLDVEKDKIKAEEEWRRDLKRDDVFYVLSWVGSEAVGVGRSSARQEGTWMVSQGYVEESFRKRNIGRKMLIARLQEIKERGGTRAITYTNPLNVRSQHLLDSVGFKKFDDVKDKEGREWWGFELSLIT